MGGRAPGPLGWKIAGASAVKVGEICGAKFTGGCGAKATGATGATGQGHAGCTAVLDVLPDVLRLERRGAALQRGATGLKRVAAIRQFAGVLLQRLSEAPEELEAGRHRPDLAPGHVGVTERTGDISVTAVTGVIGVSGVIGGLRRVVPEGGAVRASVRLPSLTRADHVRWLTIREGTDLSKGKGQFVRSAGRSVIAR